MPGSGERGDSFFARLGLPLVALGTASAGSGYLAALLPGQAPIWTAYALAAGIGGLLTGLLLLGARRKGFVPQRLAWVFVATGVWVAGGLMLLLALPGVDRPDAPLFLGLPRRAAFLLLGVGLAPGLVIPLAYGLAFDRDTLSEDDLHELREAARRVREAAGERPPQ
jgi:hypothetical protein